MTWKPHVTVAAIIERDQQFLVVEEHTEQGRRFNQPAGHLEDGESLTAAVQREVLEETGWQFEPKELIAVQLWRKTAEHPTFLRFCFSGQLIQHESDRSLDPDIIATHWLSRAQLAENPDSLRSPLVLKSIDEYLKNQPLPLSVLHTFLDPA
ncbi:MAG: NUDIX hydrolase [Methylococcaceae bacterium]|jgi:ADP-ribose pyrophosphatase YjhB (NUDIX family)|nr:NUDIX hydrolase [Methylococcaceae bacterium]